MLIRMVCAGLLLLEGGLSADFLLTTHLARHEIAAGFTIVTLAAFCLLTGTSRFRIPPRLHFLWLTGSGGVLTLLPWIFGRAWLAIPGFLAGYIPLLVAEFTRCDTPAARGQDVHRAIEADRERMARDLHDLLGHSLSMITLKSEVVLRRVPQQDGRARQELTEIIATSRQALHDVRVMAHDMHRPSLTGTVDSIRPTLDSLGIELTVRIGCGRLPQDAEAVLAAVVREGVTNLLKHSKAGRCRIEVSFRPGRVRLAVTNDGAPATPPTHTAAGLGLNSLAARVGGLGGRFSSGALPHSRFRLVVELPLRARRNRTDSAESEWAQLSTA